MQIVEGFLAVKKIHSVRVTIVLEDMGIAQFILHLFCRFLVGTTAFISWSVPTLSVRATGTSWEKLVSENPACEGSVGLTEKMRRLVSAASCAIKMCSKDVD